VRQTRGWSLLEAVTNVLVGYGVAVSTQMLVFPLFGLHATLQENLLLGLVFTVVSLARSYVLRRAFEGLLGRRQTPPVSASLGRQEADVTKPAARAAAVAPHA